MDGRGVRITHEQFLELESAATRQEFTQYHFLRAQAGSNISRLYIPGPTGQGLFGSLSHNFTSDFIGPENFARRQTEISTEIARNDLGWIRDTIEVVDGQTFYYLPNVVQTIELEIEAWQNLNLPPESYAGHVLVDFIDGSIGLGSVALVVDDLLQALVSEVINPNDTFVYLGVEYNADDIEFENLGHRRSNFLLGNRFGKESVRFADVFDVGFINVNGDKVPVTLGFRSTNFAIGRIRTELEILKFPDIYLSHGGETLTSNGEVVPIEFLKRAARSQLGVEGYDHSPKSLSRTTWPHLVLCTPRSIPLSKHR